MQSASNEVARGEDEMIKHLLPDGTNQSDMAYLHVLHEHDY